MQTACGYARRFARLTGHADPDHRRAWRRGAPAQAGDAVLREFATRIRRDTRGIDLACRLGGEEFVVVMPDCDLAKVYQVGERLRQCIEAAPFEVGGKVGLLQVRASVGVAALEFDDMLKPADQALCCAKR